MARITLKSRGFTLIEVLIVIAIVGILIAVVVGLITGESREDRCRELCDGLRHRMVKVTPDACICEDPETKKRQAYPLQRRSYGTPGPGPFLWEAE